MGDMLEREREGVGRLEGPAPCRMKNFLCKWRGSRNDEDSYAGGLVIVNIVAHPPQG